MTKGLSLGVLVKDSTNLKLDSPALLKNFNDLRGEYFTTGIEQEVGFDQNFFYEIQQYKANRLVQCERGVGYLLKQRTKNKQPSPIYLVRNTPLSYWDGYQMTPLIPGRRVTFSELDTHITISTYLPPSYNEALQGAYSVLCSSSPQTPTPVELPEKTLLGRLDGRIQSIDSGELLEILTAKDIIGAISKHEGAIELRTKLLSLVNKSGLSISSIKLKPFNNSNRPEPSEATIIYNSDSKCLELGTGDKWLKIKTEE